MDEPIYRRDTEFCVHHHGIMLFHLQQQATPPFSKGISKASWHLVIRADTTTPSYWLNWRVLVCAIWITTSIALTVFLISRYEGPQNSRNKTRETQKGETSGGVLYEDEL